MSQIIAFVRHQPSVAGPGTQRGAALYVALVMLILLAIIGITGLQVVGMQERMAASYRAFNLAFQNSEATVREAECAVTRISNREALGSCDIITDTTAIDTLCTDFNPAKWAAAQSLTSGRAVNVRRIDGCGIAVGWGSAAMGSRPVNDEATMYFQITAYAPDAASNASSHAAVDTMFIL